jgi:glycosyltransferase involved in cell wall biosynthesis
VITRLNVGGPSIHAISLSREMGADGFDTQLIHGRLGPAEGDMTTIMPLDGSTTRQVPQLVRPISPLLDLVALWRLYRQLRQWRPDIVHTHMAKAGAIGRLAAVLYNWTRGAARRARIVHTYHGHVFEGYFGSPSTRVFLFIERWLGRRSDALIAISPQVRRDVLQTYGIGSEAHVRLIPLGFDLERLASIAPADRARARAALDLPPGAFVVTTVGRLTAIKCHWLFLDAAVRVSKALPNARFLIVGDGELRADLEAQMARENLGAAVRFLGWRADLETIYAATDVFVLTSRNEGTPVALIEAMAAAVASVSTDVGGVRDVIADPAAGALVPFGDAEALSAAVVRFAESDEARRRAGSAARASVLERYDLRRLLRDMGALYRELLEVA